MLAHHLEAAISYGEATGLAVDDLRPAAVAALREAGDRAWALNVIGRATHLYGRAIDASPGEPDAELQFLHARALMFAEGIRDDARLLRQAIDGLLAAGKNELAAMALVTLDRQLWRRSAPEAGLLERALELVAEAGPTTTRGRVLATVAARWTIGGRPREALPLAEEAVSIARANGNPSAEAEALSSLSVALTGADDLVRGAETARHALELALLCGSGDAGRCYANAATFDLELGNVERAAELHREGLALMQRLGNQVYGEWLAAEVALDNYDLGAWDEAVRDARAQLSAREKLGTPHYMDGMLRLVEVAMTYAREGHLSTERVAVSLDAYRAIGDPQALGPTLAESAELLAFAGHAGAASELLDEYLEMRSRGRQSPGPWTVRGVLAWLLVRSEPVPDELFSGSPVPWTHAAAAIRDGDLANAADRLESIGARTVAAEVRFHAARSLTQTDTTEAARLLELAAAFWRSVGATARLATVEEVGAELRAAAS
jgi:tetratricopeptide (TPR) repeat protein